MRRYRLFAAVLLFLALAVSAFTQTLDQLSDKDKEKMAAIAQRPDVQTRIETAWNEQRERDMQYVATLNRASRLRDHLPLADWEQYGQLYDNPIPAKYVNQTGQRLVPANSPNFYAFRLLLDPVPRAEALSTGTILISTGLVSLLDNEAQLAYVLAHEIAHIERQHAYNRLRNTILEEEFNREKEKELQTKKKLLGIGAAVTGGLIGGAVGGLGDAFMGAAIGGATGFIAGHFIFRNKFEMTAWTTQYENEADEAGLQYMLEQNYDAREIPRLYARIQGLVSRDNRLGLGFIGSPARTRERSAQIQRLLSGSYKPQLEAKLKTAGLIGSTPEFSLLMAALKRDNGAAALDYDLFAMAKDNLEEAVQLRSNDPRAYYYLGQVYALTGRTADDKQRAVNSYLNAIKYDADRGAYPEPHLEEALYLASQNNPALQDQIKNELKTYVALYQRNHSGALPSNMYVIYDYFLLAGDKSWYVPPAAVISTKNVDSLNVTQVSTAPPTDTASVVRRATMPVTGISAASATPTPVQVMPVKSERLKAVRKKK